MEVIKLQCTSCGSPLEVKPGMVGLERVNTLKIGSEFFTFL